MPHSKRQAVEALRLGGGPLLSNEVDTPIFTILALRMGHGLHLNTNRELERVEHMGWQRRAGYRRHGHDLIREHGNG